MIIEISFTGLDKLSLTLRNSQLNIVRMSNIMNIDMKPFDPTTYEAEEPFTTEVEGKKQHIRLEENVVRWRPVQNREGHTTVSVCLQPSHLFFCKIVSLIKRNRRWLLGWSQS